MHPRTLHIRVALAVAVALTTTAVVGCNNDSGDNVNATCTLGVKGLTALAAESKHVGDAAGAINALEPVVVAACEGMINQLFDNPSTPVNFKLKTPSGPVLESITLQQLRDASQAPPQTSPTIPPERFKRILDCVDSYSGYEYAIDLCVDGVIEP